MRFRARIREPAKVTARFKSMTLPLSGGYEEGYAQGRAAGYTEGEAAGVAQVEEKNAAILADCNAVLPGKGVGTADSLEAVPQRVGEIKTEPMWLPYIGSAQGMFREVEFPSGTELVIEVPGLKLSVREMFQSTINVTGVKIVTGIAGAAINGEGAFRYNTYLQHVDLSEFLMPFSEAFMMFYGCSALEEIEGELNVAAGSANNFTSAFIGCNSLREVRFAGGVIEQGIRLPNSPNLSDESVQSIIDGLADLTGQTALTLQLHATVGAKLTEEQKETVAAKNWTLTY